MSVDGGILGDLIHALADTDTGGEVDDQLDATQGFPDLTRVADVTDEEFGVATEVRGAAVAGTVNLRDQAVKNTYTITVTEKLIGEVRTDETGSPRN